MQPNLASAGVQALVVLIELAFFAGGAWFVLRQVRRDVNGLGQKFGRVVALLVRWADTEEKREQLAKVIEGAK